MQVYFGLAIVKLFFSVKNSFANCRKKASEIVSFREYKVKKRDRKL